MTDAGGDVAGRRYLIAVGVGAFRDPAIDGLPGVAGDVRRVRELLEPMGYTPVLTELATDPTRDALAESIEDWTLETSLGPDDVVVVYFAGHGVHEEDRHYLLCTDTRPGRWTRALAAEDLARPLVKSPVGHLLVMLDTCYAGAGTADISRLAAGLADLHRGRANRWHLASARARGRAKENVFVDALADVFAHPRHGATQRYVSVREVTERVNDHFRAHRPSQQARLTTTETDGQDPFFPSPLFLPGLPTDGIDLASLVLLRRRHAGHFDPRSRGLEHAGELGDHFTGRAHALAELTAYLTTGNTDHDRKARVVTGDPGSGKSALLGRLLALTDPDSSSGPAHPDVIALHARRASLADLVTDLAGALHLPSPADRDSVLTALSARTTPVAVAVDSLDEAGTAGDAQESRRIARELLQPLSTLPAVRLVVGTRRPQIPALGHAVRVLDLDAPEHLTRADITAYARSVLADAEDPDSRSPYRDDPALAATIAEGIAERAGSSYLVARMTARALVQGQITVDTARPDWRERLPSDAREAFAAYLDRFGPDRPKAERLLRPLAYAQGSGLPWSTLWAPLAEALSGVPCSQDDLDWLHRHAGAYIVETPTPDGSAYRLFHETMAEHLRRTGNESDDHATIARTLIALVHRDPATGVNDWAAAHSYIRRHLATHATAGGILTRLLEDPEYLVHSDAAPLLRALDTVIDPVHRTVADIYRASAVVHASLTSDGRRDILAIDAARYQQPQLAAEFARTRPWAPRWATGSLVHPAYQATLTGHTGHANAVAVTEIDNRAHAVTVGGDRTVRVWDLEANTQRATLTGHTDSVNAVGVTEIDGRPHAVTAGDDRTVRVWDLVSGTERAVLTGHTSRVETVVMAEIDGRPHALTAGADGTLRVWDVVSAVERAVLTGHTDRVRTVVVTEIDGRPHALTGSRDGTVRLWDLLSGTERDVLTDHAGQADKVITVAVVEIDNAPHAVAVGIDGKVRTWNLTTGTQFASIAVPSRWVNAAVVTELDDRPHVLTASSDDGTVRVWDLVAGVERDDLAVSTRSLRLMVVADVDGRPHALATGDEGTVLVWDVASGTERTVLTGHTGSVLMMAVAQIGGRPHALSTGTEGTVRVWDLAVEPRPASAAGHSATVRTMTVTEFGGRSHAFTTGDDGAARVWDLVSGAERAVLEGHAGAVKAVAVTMLDDRYYALTVDETAKIWDLASGSLRGAFTGHTNLVNSLAVVEIDGRPHAVTAGADSTVRVWDVASGSEQAVLEGHTGGVTEVVVTEIDDRPHAISAGFDGTMRVWDVISDTERTVLTGHTRWVRMLVVTEIDGRPHVVSASEDRTVRVWDLVAGVERAVLTGHTRSLIAVKVTELRGRPHALTTSFDRTVRVWDLVTGIERPALTGPANLLNAMAVVKIDGRPHAVTTCDDRKVRVWDLLSARVTAVLTLPLPAQVIMANDELLLLGMASEVIALQHTAVP
ncbi:caspase family protein [Streptomyces sp. NPDC057696]|uniref:caspase family protein n=1 Tax=unclassified Streptomyces TaxID=2593676 RepID=UPI0036CD387D